jgi:hypothetical protein
MIFCFAWPTSLLRVLFDIVYTWELDVIRTHALDRNLPLSLTSAEAGKGGSRDLMLSGCGKIERGLRQYDVCCPDRGRVPIVRRHADQAYSLAFIAVMLAIETFLVQPLERHVARWRPRPA